MPYDEAKNLVDHLNRETYKTLKTAHKFYADNMSEFVLLVPVQDQKKLAAYIQKRLISWPYRSSEFYDTDS